MELLQEVVGADDLKVLDANVRTTEMLPSTSLDPDSNEKSITLEPMGNLGDWIHPEDLDPMPQCVAQQDQFLWLDAMTKCTSSRCTRHFLFICTPKQWLTQLSILSGPCQELSPPMQSIGARQDTAEELDREDYWSDMAGRSRRCGKPTSPLSCFSE